MYKFFTLAAAIAFVPVAQHYSLNTCAVPAVKDEYALNFLYKLPPVKDPFTTVPEQAAVAGQNWTAAVEENIRKKEYNFKWVQKVNGYCTPNRKNNLRFFYDEKGFSVEPRTTNWPVGNMDILTQPAKINYHTITGWSIRFDLDKKLLGKGTWKINDNRAEYVTDNITVAYINNEQGMRQNFIVARPLSNNKELNIRFDIRTKLKVAVINDNALHFSRKKKTVLHYEQLKVWDANGKLLAAHIKRNKGNKYSINVNTGDAVYPVTIDPLSTTPSAALEKNQGAAQFGNSVASAGDVNGDGYSDIIVGAPYYDNGQTDEGAAFMYYGSSAGINAATPVMVESNQANARLGTSVASAGDVNGDGYSDVIVGAPYYDNGQADEGGAFIYYGSASGINTTAAATLESNQANAQFGYSVASAGDVNGDGYSDVIAGAPYYDNGQTDEGAAFVYPGSGAGINTTPAAMLESNQANAYMGWSVASAGDVNGDGYSDVIAGAFLYDNGQTDEGAAFVYHGSASGISTTASTVLESNRANSELGWAVASAGDLNGDGYSDVAVGAPSYQNGQGLEGAAYIYYGSAAGISTAPAAIFEGNQSIASMGISVACAGDINGDGYSDVMLGAENYNNGQFTEGVAFVYQGSATGINTASVAILEMDQVNAQMGHAVASAGDINGDGYSDVIVGANLYDNGQIDEGAAFVYLGSAAGINTTAAVRTESNQTGAIMGFSVAAAGDVNGDGYSDVIVGSHLYDNGEANEGVAFIYHGSATGISTTAAAMLESNQAGAQLGVSVAGAGDVNGDGYSDVIAGANLYSNGQPQEGAAFIYFGSAGGINPTAATIVESNQASSQFGYSVATAGDVNGDGYSDVIVGAYVYANGQTDEGAAFVYHGSASGINTASATILECNQVGAIMGWSVAGAGDVNGDGYSDVIVGAYLYDNGQANEGAAFIYHGSASGINTTAAAMLESNQANAQMGRSVASAGDVNGDGYSDVIVGAYKYDYNSMTDEGAAFVYHGSAAGINTTAAVMLECNQAVALMGYSVASAGDVNGDGYSDVVVGAYQYTNGQSSEGAAFIYYGSPSGIGSTVAARVESDQASAYMGWSVASAGDVNGDGYSDVIAAAPQYTNGQSNEGAAFIYHGNSPGTGRRNNLRLYNSDLTTPVNSTNFIYANFGVGLFARSFLGKAKGKLVWETRVNYGAYSGSPITNSTAYTAQQSAYTDLGTGGTELKNIINKTGGGGIYTKTRARVKYDPATAITGQVYGPWRNVSAIIDGNKLGALPLRLLSFKAAWLQKGKTAQVSFTTDEETGTCCFEVQKSNDGFNYTGIAAITARNTGSPQAYSFTDNSATNKKQYYRLKIKGLQQQVTYSAIQQLQYNMAADIFVFPNPTSDILQLSLNNDYTTMTVQIINSAGQVVKQLSNVAAANRVLKIPVHDLATGSYWIKLKTVQEQQVLQFIKK